MQKVVLLCWKFASPKEPRTYRCIGLEILYTALIGYFLNPSIDSNILLSLLELP